VGLCEATASHTVSHASRCYTGGLRGSDVATQRRRVVRGARHLHVLRRLLTVLRRLLTVLRRLLTVLRRGRCEASSRRTARCPDEARATKALDRPVGRCAASTTSDTGCSGTVLTAVRTRGQRSSDLKGPEECRASTHFRHPSPLEPPRSAAFSRGGHHKCTLRLLAQLDSVMGHLRNQRNRYALSATLYWVLATGKRPFRWCQIISHVFPVHVSVLPRRGSPVVVTMCADDSLSPGKGLHHQRSYSLCD
jgi:hypothetical protein